MSNTNILNLVSEETYVSKMDTKNAILENIAEGLGGVVDDSFVTDSEHPVQSKVIKSALDDKVDKETGKGLSTNDYTTAEKDKLAGLSNITVDTALSTTSENPVQNKVVKAAIDAKYTASNATTSARGLVKIGSNISVSSGTISVPTATTSTNGVVKVDSALSSTSTNPVQNKVIDAALASKVSAVSGKGLSTNDYTNAEKDKLASLSAQDIEDIKRYIFPTITAESEPGTPVTFTKGSRALSKISDGSGNVTEYIPEFGTWTVETSIGGISISKSVTFNNLSEQITVATQLTKVTSPASLSYANRIYYNRTTTVGNYALFPDSSRGIDVYNSSLVKSWLSLSTTRYGFGITTVGNYALIAGGCVGSGSSATHYATVDAYSSSLVSSSATSLSVARYYPSATAVGDYALFAGGAKYTGSSSNTYYATVDAYSSSLVRSSATALSAARYTIGATIVGDYALFAGGNNGSDSRNDVNAYNSSLVKSTATALTYKQDSPRATTLGNYALFRYYNILDTYNSSLVKSTVTGLSSNFNGGATTVGNYALFAGGDNESVTSAVDKFNPSLVSSSATSLSVARQHLSGAAVGNYALFAGGCNYSGSTDYSTVDAYSLTY